MVTQDNKGKIKNVYHWAVLSTQPILGKTHKFEMFG